MPPRSRLLLLTLLAGLLAGPLWAPVAAATAPPASQGSPALQGLAASPGSQGSPGSPASQGPAGSGGPGGATIGGQLLAGRGVLVGRGAPALPRDVTGRAWLVADLDTGAVLGARDPHGRYLPASTLKTLTALTLLPRLTDRSRMVLATAEDCNVDGTRVGLIPKGHYRVEMLFQCLLMVSGNDCAGALAEANGGVARTVAQMNQVAQHLQALDTHAATPSGLDGPGQSTSAYDLALILRQAVRLPDFRRYNTMLTSHVPPQSSRFGRFEFANDNRLLYNYPGVLAAKNGFTDAARHTYVAVVAKGNRRLLVTLLHGEQTPVPIWQQVVRLVEWGARVPGSAAVGELVPPAQPGAAGWQPGMAASPAPAPSGSGVPPAHSAGSAAPARAGARTGAGMSLPIGLAVGGVALLAGTLTWLARRRAHR